MIIETSINPNLGWFFRDSKSPVLNYQFPVFVRYNFTINETVRITYHTFGIKLPDQAHVWDQASGLFLIGRKSEK